ncbi:hypothetical protein [Amycolatopsis arida]|uniref:hypothetical protein n=1 Tax=Amycolatopsis arida TaxID=587909 RepID=UPI00106690C7|nr:hypothetical protein [Amycolatopsis arida]TDX84964.1 hypothetical protein CLV69_11748 [Amycolatopsis arida]
MAALPNDNAPAPDPSTTAPEQERTAVSRHLHAVDTDLAAEPPAPGGQPAAAAAWLRAAFTPDSGLYTDRQPSIAETVRRARHGSQLAERGPLRTASIGYGWVAAANKAVCATWVWIVDHPARLAVVTTLAALALAFPPTRQLAVWLLTPVVWLHAALD